MIIGRIIIYIYSVSKIRVFVLVSRLIQKIPGQRYRNLLKYEEIFALRQLVSDEADFRGLVSEGKLEHF